MDGVMKTALPVIGALAVGIVLGLGLAALYWRAQSRGKRSKIGQWASGMEREAKKQETMKRIVWACIINGFAWVWCSYILAALDRVQIAEELSKVALTEIIVPVAVYAIKSGVENLSKNNRWPDRGDQEPPGTG